MAVAQQYPLQQPRPRTAPTLQPSSANTAYPQHHHQANIILPHTIGFRSDARYNFMAPSDDTRASSTGAAETLSSMITVGLYVGGSGELRAALARLLFEPSASRHDMVMNKQEVDDDVEDDDVSMRSRVEIGILCLRM